MLPHCQLHGPQDVVWLQEGGQSPDKHKRCLEAVVGVQQLDGVLQGNVMLLLQCRPELVDGSLLPLHYNIQLPHALCRCGC
jgi:hypothetical protein